MLSSIDVGGVKLFSMRICRGDGAESLERGPVIVGLPAVAWDFSGRIGRGSHNKVRIAPL